MTTTTRSAAKKQEEASGAPPAEHAEPGSKHKTDESAALPSPKRSKKAEKKEKGSAKEAPPSDETKHEEQQPRDDTHKTRQKPTDQNKDAPSSILEKGIIYFFHRTRVDTDPHPSSLNDIARSYLLLRPLAPKSKDDPDPGKPAADAAASPTDKARLILVPKKTLPRTGRDRWTAVVEKAGASFAQLRDEFLGGSEYETKTRGTRHTPAATPVGEGVYAITSTGGRASHLAYLLTLPSASEGGNGKEGEGKGGGGGVELGEVQKKMGLRERGSFVVSTRNPEFGGPEGARVGKGAEYPEELLKEFRSLRWVPTQPKHLDYVGTQFLMVGESSGVEKALEPQEEDVKEGKEEPEEEMERLEEEDAERLEGLGEDDAGRIYADLQVDAREYPKLQTSF